MYELIGGYNNHFRKLTNLTDAERGCLINCSQNISKLNVQINRIKSILKSYEDLEQMLLRCEDESVTLEEVEENFKLLISNFLTQVRGFLDNSQAWLIATYSKSSYQFQKFQDATAHEYDSCFEYRFINQLRNYIQHKNEYPFSNVSYKLDEYTNKRKLDIIMDKNFFIKDYKAMKAEFRNELEGSNFTNIDILKCIKQEKECLTKIENKTLSALIDKEMCGNAIELYEIKAKFPKYELFAISKEGEFEKIRLHDRYELTLETLEMNLAEYILRLLTKKK